MDLPKQHNLVLCSTSCTPKCFCFPMYLVLTKDIFLVLQSLACVCLAISWAGLDQSVPLRSGSQHWALLPYPGHGSEA